MYKVESDFEYKGYRCVCIFGSMGHRCGYVGVPEGSKFYGKSFNDKVDIKFEEIEGQSVGKRSPIVLLSCPNSDDDLRLDLLFDVHGGLTFGSGGKNSDYPVESDLWWLGFDCAHCDDGKDLDLVEELFGDDEKVQRYLKFERRINEKYPMEYLTVRTQKYVEDECKNLVEQIIRWDN